MPLHSLPLLVSCAYAFNALLFFANIALYAFNFHYARKQNRRLAALVRQVRAEVEHGNLIEFRADLQPKELTECR